MAEVKWIKIVTDVFDDEKILMIESIPEADSIIVIWFKLLCLAGKQNNSGVFLMGHIPYTDEMFATVFRRPLNTIRLALQTFERFGMVEIVNDTVTIPNWDKHQSLDSYEKKKERDRLYQAKRRAEQKALIKKSSDKSSDIVVSEESRLDKEESRLDKEGDLNIERIATTTLSLYGKFNNVLLSDTEYENLKKDYPNYYESYIDKFSCYIEGTGKVYKKPYAIIVKWLDEDKRKDCLSESNSYAGYDLDLYEKMLEEIE